MRSKPKSKQNKTSKKQPPPIDHDELIEAVDDLLNYFEITDDSYSEAPYMAVYDGQEYQRGVIDSELHDVLLRLYSALNPE